MTQRIDTGCRSACGVVHSGRAVAQRIDLGHHPPGPVVGQARPFAQGIDRRESTPRCVVNHGSDVPQRVLNRHLPRVLVRVTRALPQGIDLRQQLSHRIVRVTRALPPRVDTGDPTVPLIKHTGRQRSECVLDRDTIAGSVVIVGRPVT